MRMKEERSGSVLALRKKKKHKNTLNQIKTKLKFLLFKEY